MSFLSGLFKKKRVFTEGSVIVSEGWIRGVGLQYFPEGTITLRDRTYFALQESKLESFVNRYYDKELWNMGYHQNGEEFPDCDDFARIAIGSILRGAAKEGFRYAPLFGTVVYTTKKKERHMACFGIASSGEARLFEPQNGQWQEIINTIGPGWTTEAEV